MLLLILALIIIFFSLLMVKPRSLFFLILGALILFYEEVTGGVVLFTIGLAKIYPGDLIMASIFAFLIWRISQKGTPSISTSVGLFSLFFAWGILAIVRGIPSYGYSAVGEARWYILQMLYYFFILVAFKDRQQIQNAIKWFVGLTLFMIPFSSVNFYFLGGKEQVDPQYWLDPREIFRFIRGTEGLLVAIVLVGLLLFYVFGEIRKHQVLLYILFGILLITVIMIQTRAVWLAAAVGIGAIGVLITLRLIRGRLPRQSLVLLIISGTLLLFTFSILVVSRASTIYTTAANELSFFQNPLADHTASWRLAGWQQELQKAMQNPLLGQGLGGYSEWFDGQIWQRVTIHNDYIMYFSKFGVIGLLLLFSGIFFWYLEMGRYTRVETDKYYKLLSRAIQIGVLMHMFFACFYYFTIFFWMLLAAGTVLARRNVSNKLVPQQEGINPATEASNT